jgi:hypothetical protein
MDLENLAHAREDHIRLSELTPAIVAHECCKEVMWLLAVLSKGLRDVLTLPSRLDQDHLLFSNFGFAVEELARFAQAGGLNGLPPNPARYQELLGAVTPVMDGLKLVPPSYALILRAVGARLDIHEGRSIRGTRIAILSSATFDEITRWRDDPPLLIKTYPAETAASYLARRGVPGFTLVEDTKFPDFPTPP